MLAYIFLALVWFIAGLFLLILAITSAPVKLRAQFQSTPKVRFRLQISPFGGSMPYLTLVDSDRPKQRGEGRLKRGKKQKTKQAFSSRRAQRIIRNGPKLILDVLRRFRFQELVVNARFGLNDPADTGAVFGLLCPIMYGPSPMRCFSVAVVPDYERVCFVGNARAVGSVVPLCLIPPITRFSWRSFFPWNLE